MKITRMILSNSEGWKRKAPKLNQTLTPLPFGSTPNTKVAKIRSRPITSQM